MSENTPIPASSEGAGEFLFYQIEDGQTRLQVRLHEGTVCLAQRLLAELYQKDIRTVNEHIQNILEEGELAPEATIRKFRIVQSEGGRQVSRLVDFYNLPMILAVGYRVRSLRTHKMAQDRAESEQWNPEGVRAISRGLSVATPPDGRPNRISTPKGSQSFRHDQRNHQPESGIRLVFVRLSGLLGRLLRPLRGRGYIFTLSGGVAALNPRLMAGNPPGCNTLECVHFRITANTAGGQSKNTRELRRVEGLRLEDWQ